MEKAQQQGHLARFWLGLLCLLSAVLSCSAASASEPFSEYELKAAYLFNFLKFVEWPQEQETGFQQLSLCSFSADSLLPFLKQLEKKQVRGHSIAIRVYDSVEDIADCHLIYLNGISSDKRSEILASIAGKPVLSVGEEGQYSNDKEIINFFTEGGKLRFDINYRQVRESGIEMSSRLLKLARVSEK